MDVSAITQLIGSLGFPIVCCGVLFYQNYKQSNAHKEETRGFIEAINANTIAVEKMITVLENYVKEGE